MYMRSGTPRTPQDCPGGHVPHIIIVYTESCGSSVVTSQAEYLAHGCARARRVYVCVFGAATGTGTGAFAAALGASGTSGTVAPTARPCAWLELEWTSASGTARVPAASARHAKMMRSCMMTTEDVRMCGACGV